MLGRGVAGRAGGVWCGGSGGVGGWGAVMLDIKLRKVEKGVTVKVGRGCGQGLKGGFRGGGGSFS